MDSNEDIISYTVEYSIGTVFALIGVFDQNHKVISHRSENLGPEGFSMLMSANPQWAPEKPADTFRKDDLLALIAYLEAQ